MTGSGTNYSNGVEYSFSSQPNQFSVGENYYHFEGLQGSDILRFPSGSGELSFTVQPTSGNISLTMNDATCIGENVWITAYTSPPQQGITVLFNSSNPSSGNLTVLSSLTNSDGFANSQFQPISQENTNITATAAGYGSVTENLMINNCGIPEYVTIYAEYYSGTELYSDYKIHFEVDDPDLTNVTYIFSTSNGYWINSNNSTISFIDNNQGYQLLRVSQQVETSISLTFNNTSYFYSFVPFISTNSFILPFKDITTLNATNQSWGFDWNGNSNELFLSDNKTYSVINPNSWLKSTPIPQLLSYQLYDIQFQNSSTFFSTATKEKVYKINPANGNIIDPSTTYDLSDNLSMGWTNDDSKVFVCTEDETIDKVVLNSSLSFLSNLSLSGSVSRIYDIAYRPVGTDFLIATQDNLEVKIYNSSGSIWNNYANIDIGSPNKKAAGICFKPDGNILAVSDMTDGLIRLYNPVNNYSALTNIPIPANKPVRCRWNPVSSKNVLAVGCLNDGYIYFFNMDNYSIICKADLPGNEIYRLNWSPDGNVLAASVVDQSTLFLISPFDHMPPTISMTNPINPNFQTTLPIYTITGSIIDESAIYSSQININNLGLQNLILDENGSFNLPILLDEGINTFSIEAKDKYFKTSVLEFQIERVTELLSANFLVDNTQIQVGENVLFSDNSTGNPISWQWTFEGGTPTTSSLPNPPLVSYNTAGTFDVSLTVSSASGSSNTFTLNDYITVLSTIQGLVAYYPFNGNANDESNNGNDGTPIGGVVPSIDRFGVMNKAFDFDGDDDHIWIGEKASLKTSNGFTLAAWFQTAQSTRLQRIYRWGTYGNSIYIDSGQLFGEYYSPTNQYIISSSQNYADGNFHFAVLSLNNSGTLSELKLYVDGQLVNSISNPIQEVFFGVGGAAIGKDGDYSENYFDGKIDDIRIYNRALSYSEIQQLFNDQAKNVVLKVFPEGIYNSDSHKLNYSLNSAGTPQYSLNIADKISISLAQSNFPYSILRTDHNLNLLTLGLCSYKIPNTFNSSYYVVLNHRNSLETWSTNPVSFGGSNITYNFTDIASKAFGDNLKLIDGRYCLYAGDVNQDNSIDPDDINLIGDNASNFSSGYIPEDVNGDGIIDAMDIIITDNNASNFATSITPLSTVFTCGTTALTVTHVTTSGVAPVDKTVTYGTITNIPGEPLKCWITSNLGADHQAITVDDATEASAGWYWQFNRKQGFKHDGTTRTPNNTWINSISENSNWTAANDPCTLELGSGWRIPTYAEWANVDANGDWFDWTGPWNSSLKLHAAGYLETSDGSLDGRGSGSFYWSNMQNDASDGWHLFFTSSDSYMNYYLKIFGFSLRCLRGVTIPNVTTSSITSITQTTAIGGGEVINEGDAPVTARGICWSINSNPTIADSHTINGSGPGTFTSNLTGLTNSITYFVRAYATNSMGTAYGNEVSFVTLGSICGTYTLTITHLTNGGVAPVDKTVTYGTVNNIPGEPSKCWITSNLGADHQATAVDDATEASAGWYWQFNRKQGFKHDGTTRTPNTTWITPINENSDWSAANDPCALELGTGWRIPTKIEWTNVDASGGWSSWTGPWNSSLKLHAAGYLSLGNGSLSSRGSLGNYWSNAQYNATDGWILRFYSSSSSTLFNNKANTFSLRCLRD